jgi:hypothetical protein
MPPRLAISSGSSTNKHDPNSDSAPKSASTDSSISALPAAVAVDSQANPGAHPSHPVASGDVDAPPAPGLSEIANPSAAAHVREVTLRIGTAESKPVDVQVNQRQGQVYVAVRTADPGLQSSLRQDLPQLVNSLDHAGFRTETYVPHVSGAVRVSSAVEASFGNAAQDSSHDSRGDSAQERGGWGRDSSHSSAPQDQEQQQQRQREQMHNRWLNQMED